MKRVIAMVLVLMLLGSVAVAESIDWSSMTDDEIRASLDAGKAELSSRQPHDDETVVYDNDGHKLTLFNMRQGNYMNYSLCVEFDAVYENNSDGEQELILNGSYVNGWDTGALRSPDTTPGHKEKFNIVIGLDNTDVQSIEDIEKIEFVFGYLDKEYHYEDIETVVVYQK